jgi:hypothetical protein
LVIHPSEAEKELYDRYNGALDELEKAVFARRGYDMPPTGRTRAITTNGEVPR